MDCGLWFEGLMRSDVNLGVVLIGCLCVVVGCGCCRICSRLGGLVLLEFDVSVGWKGFGCVSV